MVSVRNADAKNLYRCTQCQNIFLTPAIRSDIAKANLTVRQLTNYLLQLKINAVDNRNITDQCIGRKGLHLNFSGAIQLAKKILNFIKIVLKCERMTRHQ